MERMEQSRQKTLLQFTDKKLIWGILCLLLFYAPLRAQDQAPDTLHVGLQEAEKIFLQKNLLLLAQKYNVDAAKALIIQAKLWNNPNFSVTQGVYNTETGKYFQMGATHGEESMELQQLFLLAGKRNKQIKMAETNYKLAEYGLYDLLRTLKYTLRTDFYNIYYLLQSAKVYNEEISSLQKVVDAYREQSGKGYLAQTEVVRIQAQLYSLQSEFNDLQNQINDKESELRLILQVKGSYIVPRVDSTAISSADPFTYKLSVLIDSAYQNRTDLMIAQGNLSLSRQNYAYQKALAIPDISLGVGYDKNGSYVHNFNSVGLSFDVPLFNRNQGNIRSAKSMIDYNNFQLESTRQTIAEQVSAAVRKAVAADRLYKSIDPRFSGEFDRLAQQVLINYQKRNIGLLEFLDFYDSYKSNTLQLNNILFNRVSAFEDINYATGSNFFNY